jgi:hypothetical protein
MLERIDASPDFLRHVCFSDEATFHVSGVVNRYIHTTAGFGAVKIHVTREFETGSPKVNMWAGLMHDK